MLVWSSKYTAFIFCIILNEWSSFVLTLFSPQHFNLTHPQFTAQPYVISIKLETKLRAHKKLQVVYFTTLSQQLECLASMIGWKVNDDK
jgi:hypothetical protein